jgi:large subunit ribosomal protein L10
MDRDQKTAVIDELAEDLGDAEAIFAVDYKGISVPQAAELRSKLRESDAQFKVVKNRLAKLAAEKAGTTDIDELLTGPIALTLIKGDAVVAAKTITDFAKEHEILEYRGGIMDGAPLDADAFKAISRLPGRDVLHGQLVGLAASPLTGLVAGMSNLISGLGRQLAQIAEQGLVTGEAPAAEETPAEEEAPAAEPAEEPSAGSDPSNEAEENPNDADTGSDPSDAAGEEPADEEAAPAEETAEAEAEEPAAETETETDDETPEED